MDSLAGTQQTILDGLKASMKLGTVQAAYDRLCGLTAATSLSDIKATRDVVTAIGDMVDLERRYQTEFY